MQPKPLDRYRQKGAFLLYCGLVYHWFPFARLYCALIVLLAAMASYAQPAPRQFPPGSVTTVEQIPPSRFRSQLDRLPPNAQNRALAWLRNFHFTEQDLNSLHADPSGGIYYADHFPLPAARVAAPSPETGAASVPVTPLPPALFFHSKPGSANILFLNFSGETVSNTSWNTSLGRTSVPAVPFSTDGDYTTFNDSEQLAIKRIWQRVSEDYSPFDIDVTTERPATFTIRTAHAVITRSTDANGQLNPGSTGGGIAYIDVFGSSTYAMYRPAWIYVDHLANEPAYVGEAASHEIGHNMGLSHDGLTTGVEYYEGHGSGDTSWAPIMGASYYANVSQWSKGDYYLANNTQDDLAVISGKIPYRADDRGNSFASSSPLNIIGGTNISATTPENDSANTNTANKGIVGNGADADIFSFKTGVGAVSLFVNPWTRSDEPIRAGNLDIVLELYNSAGALILTNNPLGSTFASIQTNLAEGLYYVAVRNCGVGDPLSSNPIGYTPYGSLGQYFITGAVVATSFIIPPAAVLQVADVIQTGTTSRLFTVTYSDDVAISAASIGANDIRVLGPGGYDRLARFVSINNSSDGQTRIATYAVDPPNASEWTDADNGSYTVRMEPSQVIDTEGAFVPSGQLGRFTVNVPHRVYFASMTSNPGWTLTNLWQYGQPAYGGAANAPTAGFTGANIIAYNLSGNYTNRLPLTYAVTPQINCSGTTSLTLRFRRWLRLASGDTATIDVSTNGTTWTQVWSAASSVSDASWQDIQYSLPAFATGSPSVRLRWGIGSNNSGNAIGWNMDDVEILSGGNLDTTPPTATLAAPSLVSAGSPSYSFTVTYTDNTAVAVGTLGSSDLIVTGPGGYSNAVEFISVNIPSDGTPRTATYSIAAPDGLWDAAANGIYSVFLEDEEVTDTFNNPAAAALLGTFSVAIAEPQSIVVNTTNIFVPETSNAFFTVRLALQPSSNVLVSVSKLSGDSDLVLAGSADITFTPQNWSAPVSVSIVALSDPDTNNGVAVFRCSSDALAPIDVFASELDHNPPVAAPLSWAPPAAIVYGASLGPAQLNATSSVAGAYLYTPSAGTILNAGIDQLLSVVFSPVDSNTYSSVTSSVPISVLQKPLTVTAISTGKVYGAAIPSLSASYSGFTNGDGPASLATPVTVTTLATASSPVGLYVINVLGGSASNYALSYSNGTLLITPASTETIVSSSQNPALPGAPVTFTTRVSTVPIGAGTVDGAVQFKVDGTNFGAPVNITNELAVLTTSSIALGLHSISVGYPGSSNLLASFASLNPSQLINTPPVAGTDTLARLPAGGAKILISDLLANDVDSDGDTPSFVSCSNNSAHGGLIAVEGPWVVYTPAIGFTNTDTFTYQISDGRGAAVTGAVLVNAMPDGGFTSNVTVKTLETLTIIEFNGIPGRVYRLQFSDNVSIDNWQDFKVLTASESGLLLFTDTNAPPDGVRSYRAVAP